ncbi:MAG: hypothetical protein GY722_04425 [bacterium]|nr:hypothetical protein [bacterium]
MASAGLRPNLRTDPVIEVARRSAVTLVIVGGSLMAVASFVQFLIGDSTGAVTLMASAPTTLFAILLRRQARPNVVLLLALIAGIALISEVYAAAAGHTAYVAGIGSEVVLFGLGILAVFIAREHPRPVAISFIIATLAISVVSQVHLNGPSLEIVTDLVVVASVMGTLAYLVIRVLDSLSESQTRYSDLASIIPVATFELDLSAVIERIEDLGKQEADDALRNQDEIYASLMPSMRLSFFNDMAASMVDGYGTWYEFAMGANAEGVSREAIGMLSAIWSGDESGAGEYSAIRLDGTSQDFIYRWTIGRHPGSGAPSRLVLAATDVTRLREAEVALEQQLRERDQFVASVSHELRTPLTSILGLTDELVSRPDSFDAAEQAELLGIVAAETRDVVDIVEDLLVTARAEAGQLHVSLEPCDLTAEMRRVSDLMGGDATGHDPVWVFADPVRLRQVLRNLVSNAFRHGGHSIRMSVISHTESAAFVIRDNGEPLSESERERIFLPYERSGGETVVESVGLGLHVARLLARKMGGDLTYDHDGSDTVFRLDLTLLEPAAIDVEV